MTSPHKGESSDFEDPGSGSGNQGGKSGCGCGGDGRPCETGGDPHAGVSSEGGEATAVEPGVAVDQVVESFDGDGKVGELEEVTGFDPQRALTEGLAPEIMTSELMQLRDCRPEGAGPETVCGHDDRVQITATTQIPWRWICQLIITWPSGGQARCSGWFIGPKAVMTAGHCVYSRGAGGWARRIEVIPGMSGSARPYGSMIGTSFRSVLGWTRDADQTFDYGCIILPSPTLGNQVGYFGFASLTDSSLSNLLTNNSGYAGDKPFGTQWFNAGRVSSINARKIYYMLDTYGGQSGSPTWRYQNGQRQAVGIHAYGGCPNSSTRITSAVFNNMVNWRNS
jgi:glutamyl endopeptidase